MRLGRGLFAAAFLALLLASTWAYRQQPLNADAPAVARKAMGEPEAAPEATRARAQLPAFLPPEARATIAMVQRGGPFPHRQDGSVFGNRERRLPLQPRGWYREYTVATPGADNRGARRIVTGGQPPRDWYYTDDHYGSFRAFRVPEEGR